MASTATAAMAPFERPLIACGSAAMAPADPELVVDDAIDSCSNSSTISPSSMATSFIDWKRRSGSFARHRRIVRRSSAGTDGLMSAIGSGLSCRMRCITSTSESAANGRRRVAAS